MNRRGESWIGVIIGIIGILLAIWFFFKNEATAKQLQATLQEIKQLQEKNGELEEANKKLESELIEKGKGLNEFLDDYRKHVTSVQQAVDAYNDAKEKYEDFQIPPDTHPAEIEALRKEKQALKDQSDRNLQTVFSSGDALVRFVRGWKGVLTEIQEHLNGRITNLSDKLTEPNDGNVAEVNSLVDGIAENLETARSYLEKLLENAVQEKWQEIIDAIRKKHPDGNDGT